jgi:hypothetical protein
MLVDFSKYGWLIALTIVLGAGVTVPASDYRLGSF